MCKYENMDQSTWLSLAYIAGGHNRETIMLERK